MGTRPRKPVTTPSTRERRVEVRLSVDTYIRAAVSHEASARKVHGWVLNVSAGGLFIQTPDRLPADAPVRIDALARIGEELIHFKADGWVAHADPEGLGVQFDALDDEMARRLAALIERFSPAKPPGVSDPPSGEGSGEPRPT
jgi:PilZ domain